MTPELFSHIRELITIYGTGKVNINTASQETFLALGLDGTLVDEIINYRAGPDRQEGTEDDKVFANLDSVLTELGLGLDSSLAGLITAGELTVKSSAFCINATGALDNNRLTKVITAVVERDGNKLLYWHEE
jgi:hypothetical protein